MLSRVQRGHTLIVRGNAPYIQGLRDAVMTRLLTTPVENVEWSRYLREVSEKEKYNSAVVVKLTGELETAEQLKDDDVSILLIYNVGYTCRSPVHCGVA